MKGFLAAALCLIGLTLFGQTNSNIGVPVFPAGGQSVSGDQSLRTQSGRVGQEQLDRWADGMTEPDQLPSNLLINWQQAGTKNTKPKTLGRGETKTGASGFSVITKSSSRTFAGAPDPFIWLNLFSPKQGVSLVFEDLGAVQWNGINCRLLSFSGLMGGDPVMLPQRWAGQLWVDELGRIHHLEAEPVGQKRRLQVIEAKYRTATTWLFFKVAKKPKGVSWSVTFGPGPEGLWLPTVSRWQDFKVDHKGKRTVLKKQVDRFTEPRLAGVKVETDFSGLEGSDVTSEPTQK